MSEYLLPNNENLSIEEQQYIFSIRNRMIQIESNFKEKEALKPCICGEEKDMKHIYICKNLNEEDVLIKYEEIFEENVRSQKIILKRFRKSFENCKKYEDKSYHGILNGDPLYVNTVMEIK